jgi:hypothetical protein
VFLRAFSLLLKNLLLNEASIKATLISTTQTNCLASTTVKTISTGSSIFEPHEAQSKVFLLDLAPNMILPFFLSAALWFIQSTFLTQLSAQQMQFKQLSSFKPNELQALNIKLDYGYSPEPHKPSRREKIALKLTQITK